MTLSIRRAKAADKEKVLALRRRVRSLAYTPKHDKIFSWKFKRTFKEKPCPFWVLEDTDTKKIVASVPSIPVKLICRNKVVKLHWGVDICRDDDVPGLGVKMLQLMLAWRKSGDITMGKGTSPSGYIAQKQLGWRDIKPEMRLHMLVLNSRRSSRYITKIPVLGSIAGIAAAPLLTSFKKHVGNASKIESVDASFDDLWRRVRLKKPFMVVRDREYVSWRFKQHPLHKYQLFAVGKTKLKGYIACRMETNSPTYPGLKLGIIADFLVEEPAVFKELLGASINYFKEQKADCIIIACTDKTFIKYLKEAGFFDTRKTFKVIFKCNNQATSEAFGDGEGLLLTLADSDGDME